MSEMKSLQKYALDMHIYVAYKDYTYLIKIYKSRDLSIIIFFKS